MSDMTQSMENISIKLAKSFKNLVILNADSVVEYGLSQFSKFFDERHFTFGLGYSNMLSAAAGMTVRGKIPLVVVDSDGVLGAVKQIKESICVPNLNVKMVAFNCSSDSYDYKIIKELPNMKVYSPVHGEELLENLEQALNNFGPAYIRISDNVLAE
ncbi:hypothetical protein HN709_02910 [Candidatus Peregrinibacteria bacterium]|jgi:transketolase|nr:hypothetical protein [Candidatus Peregrinibacteria bacterium]MBT7736614.1 hypothetical protein [Candidatus Peregrinibacteria bacterium]